MTNTQEPTKHIIKINECPSLTGNSTLTYHIGCDDANAIFFSLVPR